MAPTHVEPPQAGQVKPTSNPNSSPFNVVVSISDTIEIKMVDATVLSDFEIWFFISSILSSAFIGFYVAYLQAKDARSATAPVLWHMALVIFVLLFIAVATTFYKRRCLRRKGKTINIYTSDQALPPSA